MKVDMVRSRNQTKIRRGIIEFVPVDMVNDLMSRQGTAKRQRHDVAMFKNTLAFDGNHPVATREATFPISSLFAKERITMTDKPEIMAIAKTMTLNRGLAANRAGVRGGMLNKFASFRMPFYAVHEPSFLAKLPQIETAVKRDGGKNGVNSGEALTSHVEGNPEPSQGYTPGRCNDYRRGSALLITGLSAPPERDEIVYSSWKHEVGKTTTDCDGVGMEKPAARGACGVGAGEIAGVVAESIASGAYGLVQVWGYHSAVRVKSSTTATGACAKGSSLAGCVTSYYALANTPDTGTHANTNIKGIALAAQALYTTTATKVFIQCL